MKKTSQYLIYISLLITLLLILIGILFIIFLSYQQLKITKNIFKNFNDLQVINKDTKNNNNGYNLIEPYIKAQNDFCEHFSKFIIKQYESEIFLSKMKFNNISFSIYIYKSHNFLLNELKKFGSFEIKVSNNILQALKYYGLKKNILNNQEIIMLDIGGNIGWYPSLLGRYGYTILSFEAFEKNYYVSKKNYCYLNNSNTIVITKGLGAKESICHYYNQINNTGNGMVICDNKENKNINFIKEKEVKITTLNHFFPFLLNKNIALMKIDVEGHELKVLEGGIELITEYHIPFVVLEFTPRFLKNVGSEPTKLLHLFVDNGYKISLKGFLSKEYITYDEFMTKINYQVNCYFIY